MNRKIYILLIAVIAILYVPYYGQAQSVVCPEVGVPNQNIVFPCSSDTQLCTSVVGTFPDIRQTINGPNAYVVNSIPFAGHELFNFPAGNSILVSQDDVYSDVVNLPFTFCYYGTAYSKVIIGSNGVISFDFVNAGSSEGFGVDGYTLPNPNIGTTFIGAGNKKNTIFACFHDIDPSLTSSNKEVEWALTGTAPCRKLVVNWRNIRQFSCTGFTSTFQCILYENTNVIEMYIEKKPSCTNWQMGKAVIGVQNVTGTQAVAAPGRNGTVWTTSITNSEAWQFVPNGTSLLAGIALYNSSGVLLQNGTANAAAAGLLNATFSNLCVSASTNPAHYYIKATYNACSGANFSDTTGVTLNMPATAPPPVVTSPVIYCQYAVAVPLSAIGSGLLWYNDATGGTGSTSAPTPPTSVAGSDTFYVSQTVSGCESIRMPIVVKVDNPVVPTFVQAGPYCSGSVIPALPLVSGNGINGTWSPAINNTATTTYTFTPATGQCANTTTMTLVVTPQITYTLNVQICQGQSYSFNGVTYTTANNTARDTLQTSGGCDSIVTLNLAISPYLTGTDVKHICQGQSYTFNEVTYTTSNNTAKDTLSTSSGCDSIVTLNLTVSPVITHTVNASICAGQTYTFNGTTYTTAQSGVTGTFSTSSGCDSIVTLNLAISPYLTGTDVKHICQGQSYIFNGVTYTTNNSTAKDTLSTSSGCDSIVTLNLTVSTAITHIVNASICAGQTYTFNGTAYTTAQSGVTGTFSTSSGCDSIVTLNLTVSPYLIGTDIQTICQGQSYIFNGATYTTSNNIAKDTLSTSSGCDSIVTLNLTVSPVITHTTNASICAGQTYSFNGTTYTTAQSGVTGTFSTSSGCDSIVTFNLTVNPYLTGTDIQTICQGQSYTFNGVTYTSSNNTAKDTLSTSSGCDSIVTLNLTVSPVITHTINASICAGQTYSFNGTTYTTAQSGVTGTFSTSSGCDSIVTFNLTVNPYLTGTDIQTICQGQSYTFNGVTYTSSNNTAKDTLSTSSGCDSIVTLNLTVNPYLTGTDIKTICQGQSYTFNGVTYTTSNNTAKDTLSTSSGCDSIVTLNLTVSPVITHIVNASICAGQTYTFNGTTYTTAQSGVTGTFSTSSGCDSIVTFNLTVSPYLIGTDIQTICQGQSYTFNGVTYTTSNNTAKDTLSTSSGCDSIVTLNLTVSPVITHIVNASICAGQTYTFNGTTYTTAQSGVTGTFSTSSGCDSIVTLNLTVSPYLIGTDIKTICQGQSYIFNGVTYTTSNSTAKDTLSTSSGCDSIVTLNLTVSPVITHIVNASICAGQTYTFNGTTYTTAQSGVTGTFSTSSGCDSIVTFNLTVSPYLTGTDIKTICQGQSYIFNGVTYTTSNNIAKDTLSTSSGCDSIVTLNLTVSTVITHIINASICAGQTYTFNGTTYTTAQSGVTGTFSTSSGCDSIVTFNLTVSPYLIGTDIQTICQGQSYTFNGVTYTSSNNTAKDTLSTSSGCDSIVTLNLTVNPYLTGTDIKTICQGQSYTFNGVTYTTSNNTAKDTLSTSSGCDSIVTLNLTVTPVITHIINASICAGQTYTFNGTTYTTSQSGVTGAFSTSLGCDSIVTFNLTVNPYLTGTDIKTICQGQSYTFNGVTYTTSNNTAKDTLSTSSGCDSIVTLNLTVSPVITHTINASICAGQTYTFNGTTYTTAQSGVTGAFSTSLGCDSIVTFNLTVNPYLTGTDIKTICQGQSYIFNGVTYTTSNNTAKDTLSTSSGCDSIVTLNLTVSPYLIGTDIKTICQGQSYIFNGVTYTTNNSTAKDTLSTSSGCDSIVTLNLTVSPYLTGTDVQTICQGQSYIFNGVTYTTSNNIAKDTLSTSSGCDSIVTLNLTVSPYLTGTDVQTICQGQGYTFNGVTYTTGNNTAKDTLQTISGCDSIVTLDLTVSPYLTGVDVQHICEGESYVFNGITYTSSNYTAKDTLQTAAGCDSIVTLDLTVHSLPVLNIQVLPEKNLAFCIGDSVNLNADGASQYFWENYRGDLLGTGASIDTRLYAASNLIRLRGKDDYNCTDTSSIVINAEPCCQLQVPNAFSPNGDGLNDQFGPVTNGHPQNYRLQVFNRWGQQVFVSYKLDDRWDGTMGGDKVDVGTYFYSITGNCVNKEPIHMRGDIVLVR